MTLNIEYDADTILATIEGMLPIQLVRNTFSLGLGLAMLLRLQFSHGRLNTISLHSEAQF